jgi:Na+-transporting methylmalonyl-CoA/oxaloacetate decarboxylase gamma subunit
VNVELYSYSLFTTVLGMLVVFLSLTMLSVMMVVLKAVFAAGRAQRPAEARGRAQAREVEQAGAAEEVPVWVPAAVAAYLAEEQEPQRPTANTWNAVVNQYDPWISGGRYHKRGV